MTSAFVLAEPTPAPSEWDDYLFEGRLDFDGAGKGRLILGVPVSLGREVAANLLGVEADSPELELKARDAIGEVLNMVVGNLTPQLFGPKALCQFESPQVELVSPARHLKRLAQARCCVSMVTESGLPVDLALV